MILRYVPEWRLRAKVQCIRRLETRSEKRCGEREIYSRHRSWKSAFVRTAPMICLERNATAQLQSSSLGCATSFAKIRIGKVCVPPLEVHTIEYVERIYA